MSTWEVKVIRVMTIIDVEGSNWNVESKVERFNDDLEEK